MVKLIEVYGRKNGFTRKEFFDYQHGKHFETTLLAPQMSGRIRAGVQNAIYLDEDNLITAGSYRVPYDGKDTVVELFFDNVDEILRALHDTDYLNIVRPDEEYFSDTSNAWGLMCHEEKIVLKNDVVDNEKVFIFLRCADGKKEEFEKVWPHVQQELLKILPEYSVSQMAINRKIKEFRLENGADFDLAIELWCSSSKHALNAAFEGKLKSILTQSTSCTPDNTKIYAAYERR